MGLLPATPLHLLDFLRAQLLREPALLRRLPALGHASPLTDAQKLACVQEGCRELAELLQERLQAPCFAWGFLAAWAQAGLRTGRGGSGV